MAVEVKADSPKSVARAISPGRFFSSNKEKEVVKDKKVKDKKEKDKKEKDKKEPQVAGDDASAGGEKKTAEKNWSGYEKKKPRAEFQAEIDELKSKIAALEAIKADRDQLAAQVFMLMD